MHGSDITQSDRAHASTDPTTIQHPANGSASTFRRARAVASLWLLASMVLSVNWLEDLASRADPLGPVAGWMFAIFVVAGIAWIPSYLMVLLVVTVLSDRSIATDDPRPTIPIAVIIAARNEAAAISATLRSVHASDYDGPVRVILADNGSTDGTAAIARQTADAIGLSLQVISVPVPGKARALNASLEFVTESAFVTLDADTALESTALRRIIGRLQSGTERPAAVAGHLLVANSTRSIWSRLQEWDYRYAITAIKQFQSAYDAELVAQGAFSAYDANAVRAAGGWSDTVGEDIVLTWHMLEDRRRVVFEGSAIAYTTVPDNLRTLARQRRRWGRGMIEAIREVPPRHLPDRRSRFIAEIDLIIPWMDLAYTFAWIPGLVLAAFGDSAIVGPWTLLVIPWTVLLFGLLEHHERRVLRSAGIDRPLDWSIVVYVFGFQLVQSPAAVAGYVLEGLHRAKRW